MNDLTITTCNPGAPCDVCEREGTQDDTTLVAISWIVRYVSGTTVRTRICMDCIAEVGNLADYAMNSNLMETYGD